MNIQMSRAYLVAVGGMNVTQIRMKWEPIRINVRYPRHIEIHPKH